MNKEYMESLLKDEEIIKKISKIRTQYNHIITDIIFFKIFCSTLETLNIECEFTNWKLPYRGASIILKEKDKSAEIEYNPHKLENEIEKFNTTQSIMGFNKSTNALIDIFVNLFD